MRTYEIEISPSEVFTLGAQRFRGKGGHYTVFHQEDWKIIGKSISKGYGYVNTGTFIQRQITQILKCMRQPHVS